MRSCRLGWLIALTLLLAAGWGCRMPVPAVVPSAPAPAPVAPPPELSPMHPSPAIATPPKLPPTPRPVAAPAVEPDPIATLIATVEKQYQAALQLDHEGQLDEARHGFDTALDELLASPYDIPSAPRLQRELDSLLDRIQALESDALAAGGLSQPPPQSSAFDRIAQLTFPLDAATRAKLAAASQIALARRKRGELPLVVNDPVLHYIHYFTTRGRSDLLHGFKLAGRYRAMVDRIFTAEGIPTDLIYLAQLESGFNPKLVSRAGARGMWQFMPKRAADYALKRNHWIDERMDPRLATLAAAHHLKDLYAQFGNWYLAMAAYNTGPAVIEAIVARTGYANYFKLYAMGALPHSWRNYVPVILAIALIANDPQQYGITDPDPDAALQPDRVAVGSREDLRLAADCANVTVADLQRLNPALLHLLVPSGYTLNLPQGSAGHYQEALARVPGGDRMTWRVHWVKAGESWRELSRRFRVSEKRLLQVNHARASHTPEAGTPVVLPRAAVRPVSKKKSKTPAARGHE